MDTVEAIVGVRCPDTGFYVGYVPGIMGAHSQGETIDELRDNLADVMIGLHEMGIQHHKDDDGLDIAVHCRINVPVPASAAT